MHLKLQVIASKRRRHNSRRADDNMAEASMVLLARHMWQLNTDNAVSWHQWRPRRIADSQRMRRLSMAIKRRQDSPRFTFEWKIIITQPRNQFADYIQEKTGGSNEYMRHSKLLSMASKKMWHNSRWIEGNISEVLSVLLPALKIGRSNADSTAGWHQSSWEQVIAKGR